LNKRCRKEYEIEHNILHIGGGDLKASKANNQRGSYEIPEYKQAEDVVHLFAETERYATKNTL